MGATRGERSPRNTRDFAELGERRFVRGLLPVKLASGDEFRYGIWLEVDCATFDDARQIWNDEVRYSQLRFAAAIANAAPPWREKIVGAAVEVGIRDHKSRPFVIGAREPWLRELLERGWTMAEYEAALATFG